MGFSISICHSKLLKLVSPFHYSCFANIFSNVSLYLLETTTPLIISSINREQTSVFFFSHSIFSFSQEDLAKSGYQINREVDNLGILLQILWKNLTNFITFLLEMWWFLGESFQNVPLTTLLGNCHYSKMVNFYNRKKSLEETEHVCVCVWRNYSWKTSKLTKNKLWKSWPFFVCLQIVITYFWQNLKLLKFVCWRVNLHLQPSSSSSMSRTFLQPICQGCKFWFLCGCGKSQETNMQKAQEGEVQCNKP